MEYLTDTLESSGLFLKTILESFSVFLIALGVIASIGNSIYKKIKMNNHVPLHIDFRLSFGSWLLVSLEFLLAADIVSSVISPTYENLIQLSIVAVVRTFLNYFLGKEVDKEIEEENSFLESDAKNKQFPA
jgi:uncharacterized membrane protein